MYSGSQETYNSIVYNPIRINLFLDTLPLWRRILARYFNKYKVRKEEYDKWYISSPLN